MVKPNLRTPHTPTLMQWYHLKVCTDWIEYRETVCYDADNQLSDFTGRAIPRLIA